MNFNSLRKDIKSKNASVKEIVNDIFDIGYHRISWDAEHLSTGIYFLKIQSGRFTSTQKISLLK